MTLSSNFECHLRSLCLDAKGSKIEDDDFLKRLNKIGHLIEEFMQYENLHMLQVKC